MNGSAGSGAPAWLPSSVGSARRADGATDEDLFSGRAWESFADGLRRAGMKLRSSSSALPAPERAAGFRHLLVLLALGVDEVLRPSDPYDPQITPGNVDNVLKWGMDCPDAAYSGAAVRGDATYRVWGNRGTVRYLGLQVMAGMQSAANVVADDLELDAEGNFEIVLSRQERQGSWMRLPEDAQSLIVRQFFYDWENERPARLSIECLDRHPPQRGTQTPAGLARQLGALGAYLDASLAFWLDVEEAGRAQGINEFREPAARTDLGGAAENVTVWGSWELGPDQALLIEVTPPSALYWSVALGNQWWESIDYAQHQSSLNGHQAVLDDDGVFRAVVAAQDPGVANWLDTAGFSCGPMIFRWVRASSAPVPSTRVVPLAALADALPPGTARVDPDGRRATLAARKAGVRRRFAR